MTFEVRKLSGEDLPEVYAWWRAQKWPPVSADHLSENGFIIPGYTAGWIYSTDSAIAWMEFIVANPNTGPEERAQALDALISTMINWTVNRGFTKIFTSVNHPRLKERYAKHGFVETDTGMSSMIWGI